MPCRESFNIMSADLGDYCCPDQLRDELSKNPKSLLLIDCRSQSEYSRSHVRGAINIILPSLMLKRLKRGNLNIASVIQNNEAKEKFTKNFKTATIVLYDECSTDLNVNPSSVINLLLKKMRQDGSRASFLLGGFSTFEERFPEYCQSLDHDNTNSIMGLCNLRISDEPTFEGNTGGDSTLSTCSTSSPISCPFPVQVLPYLYLGSAKNSADLAQLQKYGITYILNVTANVPNMFENEQDFKYLQIPISDHWSQNLSSFFPQAIRFIDEARNNKKGVLVHCLAGISRSVTVTVAYLMSRQSMSLNRAYDHVKHCKPNISPNFTFMGQLLDFEKDLNGEKGADSGDEILTSDSEKLSPTSSNCSPI
ncbi:dual specificity protein phosphatase 6 [Aplysia californica]|uniref:Dual specificity protein phosphatase n=1 Tax=Aplysia californica TaxID=6500 RepID=A0ABM0JQY8_APLCA|nr:dual specificity protein phosphatase 6 [Aplysia californica]XP_005099472.1 dual specificity protein phosphatase 6 [Aplysia californica]